jgi:hypothetical protein
MKRLDGTSSEAVMQVSSMGVREQAVMRLNTIFMPGVNNTRVTDNTTFGCKINGEVCDEGVLVVTHSSGIL